MDERIRRDYMVVGLCAFLFRDCLPYFFVCIYDNYLTFRKPTFSGGFPGLCTHVFRPLPFITNQMCLGSPSLRTDHHHTCIVFFLFFFIITLQIATISL